MPRARSRSSRSGSAPRRRGGCLFSTFMGLLLVGAMGVLGLLTGIGVMLSQIPSIDELLAARPLGATQVFDRDGKVIASIQNGENRDLVPLDKISEHLQHAIVASEEGLALRQKLMGNITLLRELLNNSGLEVYGAPSPIVCVRMGQESLARLSSRHMPANGLLANLVEFPAVPKGRARFRLQVMASHTHRDGVVQRNRRGPRELHILKVVSQQRKIHEAACQQPRRRNVDPEETRQPLLS